jgi:phenylpropionate dioxygenase-like ring-hydroxylating dioxygenase large terminal subunit
MVVVTTTLLGRPAMRRPEQIAEARKLLAHLERRTTALADAVYRNPVGDYTSTEQAAREDELLFRKGPINLGLSALLPRPGDWLAHDHAGVPLLLARRADGSLGAFLNVCRHRGAPVAAGCGNGATSFSCPYHGWTYGLDGSLVARPEEASFAGAERATHGLRALPVVEKYGMIWAGLRPGLEFDIDALLDGAAADLAAYNLASFHHYETRVLRRAMNWKLAVDTFGETYHLHYLHTDTIAPLFHNNRASFTPMGRNHRLIAARRTIDELRGQPEEAWDIFDHTAVIYVLFPNTVFIYQRDHVESWHIFPDGAVDRCVMYVSLYIPEPATSDSAKRHWDNNFNLLMATVEHEDFPTCEAMQKGFLSGAQPAITFGRNEPALQHYHRNIKAALADAAPRLAAE